MIDLVQRLLDRGHAYVALDPEGNPTANVYFDVESWPQYGELTHQESGTLREIIRTIEGKDLLDAVDTDDSQDGTVSGVDGVKHSSRDFALWKAAKDSEPETAKWPTPWGKGRPGWHLECSAMSHRYLGDEFDIHGGGLDLRFPHHENEMAQSRAAGWGFAHRWMHSAWVTQRGEKMSKSIGNVLSVPAVLEAAEGNAWVMRYAVAAVQYRSMLEWAQQSLDEAKAAYERIMRFLSAAEKVLSASGLIGTDIADVCASATEVHNYPVDELPAEFTAAMNDDINIAGALAVVFTSVREGNSLIAAATASNLDTSTESGRQLLLSVFESTLKVRAMLDVLGLDPLNPQWTGTGTGGNATVNSAGATGSETSDALKSLVATELAERQTARENKDFARADQIRDDLTAAGIEIADSPTGSTWHLK
jgi:cysteinyl-tRNA synthetase